MIEETGENAYIDLTTSWIAQKYDEMNQSLFNGELGECSFGIFTAGRGSEGGVLGHFQMTRKGLYYSKSTRYLFVYGTFNDRIYVNKENFANLTHPRIELNGNYKWSEKAALSTLVHEMCHYYCNMWGRRPTQSHGYEFRSIAQRVSAKSKGIFTVERVARAEQMDEMELNSTMQAKKDKRTAAKIKGATPMIIWMKDGEVRLVKPMSDALTNEILADCKKRAKLVKTGGEDLSEFLFNLGYKSRMKAYRYWNVTGKPWLKELDRFNLQTMFSSDENLLEEMVREVIRRLREPDDDAVEIDPNANLGLDWEK